ncbi:MULTISPECIES: MmpS family transport accessory protein [Mycobacterium]|uniref:MmpS family transport accessory protein n=1 Tax=Mycobacterium TaxID=1763 RepID=UPI0022AE6ED4|nr:MULTISPECIES: MmpS family transport accessory protein [Mycobacterium]
MNSTSRPRRRHRAKRTTHCQRRATGNGDTPILSILKRAWGSLVVVATVALDGMVVERLRSVFGSDRIFSALHPWSAEVGIFAQRLARHK